MDYEQFKAAIIKRMEQLLEPDTSLKLQTICKNNGLKLDGLIISNPSSNLSPTIFLNYYYEKKELFPDLDAICKDIAMTYRQNRSTERMNADFFTNYSHIRKYIAYRIINYEKNKELLETVPYVRYLDLAIVFYCLLNISKNGNATILIHTNHLKLWNITTEQLYTQACQTTPLLLPYYFLNMTSIMSELFHSQNSSNNNTLAATFCPMYVLTNSQKLYGASCVLYPNLLEAISEQLHANLFILPSSIHEIILLPAVSHSYYKELASMVAEINRTELAAEEILSDQIYYYSKTEHALSVCT